MTATGPVQPEPPQVARAVGADDFLRCLQMEALAAGVTRLADLTGLDRIGFPVWQAVRPCGRAQSVHQGKGVCCLQARIGALAEALESHRAETVPADTPARSWNELPPEERLQFFAPTAPDLHGARQDWCTARDWRSGRGFHVPHLHVSLDLTRRVRTPFERSSAGLAVGTCAAEAVRAGLLELLERDAVGAWQRLPPHRRAAHRVSLSSIPFSWFAAWSARVREAGSTLRVFAFAALEGTPACVVYLGGREAFGPSWRVFMGSAADGSPERALFGAMAEALQSRVTFIAAARDDLLPSLYDRWPSHRVPGQHVPLRGGISFGRLAASDCRAERIAARLSDRGFPLALVKRLNPDASTIDCVRVIVPGLGTLLRERGRA